MALFARVAGRLRLQLGVAPRGGGAPGTVRDCANLEITIGGDSEASAVRSNVAVNDGRWHHVAISWKSKDGALLLHVDGAEQFGYSACPQASD